MNVSPHYLCGVYMFSSNTGLDILIFMQFSVVFLYYHSFFNGYASMIFNGFLWEEIFLCIQNNVFCIVKAVNDSLVLLSHTLNGTVPIKLHADSGFLLSGVTVFTRNLPPKGFQVNLSTHNG